MYRWGGGGVMRLVWSISSSPKSCLPFTGLKAYKSDKISFTVNRSFQGLVKIGKTGIFYCRRKERGKEQWKEWQRVRKK